MPTDEEIDRAFIVLDRCVDELYRAAREYSDQSGNYSEIQDALNKLHASAWQRALTTVTPPENETERTLLEIGCDVGISHAAHVFGGSPAEIARVLNPFRR